MNFRFAPGARFDVFDLMDWYDAQSAGLGDDFHDEFEAAVRRICQHPRAHGRVPTAPRGREIRHALTHRFLVIVTYLLTPGEIVILSVQHARSVRRTWRRRLP